MTGTTRLRFLSMYLAGTAVVREACYWGLQRFLTKPTLMGHCWVIRMVVLRNPSFRGKICSANAVSFWAEMAQYENRSDLEILVLP